MIVPNTIECQVLIRVVAEVFRRLGDEEAAGVRVTTAGDRSRQPSGRGGVVRADGSPKIFPFVEYRLVVQRDGVGRQCRAHDVVGPRIITAGDPVQDACRSHVVVLHARFVGEVFAHLEMTPTHHLLPDACLR